MPRADAPPRPAHTTTGDPRDNHRWFPGYTVAGVATLALIATAPGQTMIVSQFNAPLRDMLGLTDANAGQLNLAYTIATVAAGLPLVLVGRLTDRLGPRRTMALAAAAFALGCLAMAGAFNLITVFIGFFLIRFLGQGSLSLVAQHAVAMWFHRRLGSINGLKMVVLFGAWVPAPATAAWMITELGWRWSYAIFAAAIAAVVIIPTLLLIRDTPEQLGLRMDNDPPRTPRTPPSTQPVPNDSDTEDSFEERFGEELPSPTGAGPHPIDRDEPRPRAHTPADATADTPTDTPADTYEPAFTLKQATRTRAYWIIAGAFFLSPLVGTALLFDLQPILASLGLDISANPKQAAWPATAYLATMAIMALPAGVLTDRAKPGTLLAAGLIAIAASPGVFLTTGIAADHLALWGAMLGMSVFAIGQSIVGACGSAAVARYFGRAHHGAIRASLSRIGVIGTGIGPVCTAGPVALAAVMGHPAATGHAWAMWLFIAMSLPLAIAVIGISPPSRPADAERSNA
ncbi:MAG: MFS transporter [Phycisphaerales bacterium]